jgi:hypothetical protein
MRSKIDDLTLFTTLGALTAAWLVAVAGLALTIKREYLHTFVSLQTGYGDVQSYFLDSEGDDARRIQIFFCNEQQWRAIRDAVRQWVLNMYAAWKALMPSWLTEDLQARIPDDFMPAEVVHNLNAQAPGGRRPTVEKMGLLRRVSNAAAVDVNSDLDNGARRLSQGPNRHAVTDGQTSFTTNTASFFQGPTPTEPTASAAAASLARPCKIADDVRLWEAAGEVPDPRKLDDPADEDEYQTMPDEVPE